MNRLEYRQIDQRPGLFETRTSGSTGTVVVTQKYQPQIDNLMRADRAMQRMHNLTPGPVLKLSPIYTTPEVDGPLTKSNVYVPGDYTTLISFPSLFPDDLSQFKHVISYGERWTGVGIDMYSSEEFGTIAIQCPHNKDVMHIVPNLRIQFTPDGMRITDLDHPYLKDYEIGDYAEPRTCGCPIRWPAMSHVQGRIRNRMKYPDGHAMYPLLGFMYNMDVKRFQVIQKSLYDLDVHIDGVLTEDGKQKIIDAVGFPVNINVIQGNFRPGKHEEFICLC